MRLQGSDAADFEEFEQLFGLSVDEKKRILVRGHWQLLQAWNRKVRLTAIGSFRQALQFHFFESFWVAKHFLRGMQCIADVGSGAGFPGLAVKLFRPDLEVILLESKARKAIFLRHVSSQLGLPVEVFDGPAEEFRGWKGVEAALIRALKPSPRLIEILGKERIPLIHLHGAASEAPKNLILDSRAKVPGSRNRVVARYRPV